MSLLKAPGIGPTNIEIIEDEVDANNGVLGGVLGGGVLGGGAGEIPHVISDDDVTTETMTDSSNVSAKQCINEVKFLLLHSLKTFSSCKFLLLPPPFITNPPWVIANPPSRLLLIPPGGNKKPTCKTIPGMFRHSISAVRRGSGVIPGMNEEPFDFHSDDDDEGRRDSFNAKFNAGNNVTRNTSSDLIGIVPNDLLVDGSTGAPSPRDSKMLWPTFIRGDKTEITEAFTVKMKRVTITTIVLDYSPKL